MKINKPSVPVEELPAPTYPRLSRCRGTSRFSPQIDRGLRVPTLPQTSLRDEWFDVGRCSPASASRQHSRERTAPTTCHLSAHRGAAVVTVWPSGFYRFRGRVPRGQAPRQCTAFRTSTPVCKCKQPLEATYHQILVDRELLEERSESAGLWHCPPQVASVFERLSHSRQGSRLSMIQSKSLSNYRGTHAKHRPSSCRSIPPDCKCIPASEAEFALESRF